MGACTRGPFREGTTGQMADGSFLRRRTIRGTDIDAVVLCLWVERGQSTYLKQGGFDGAYTYFAASGMTFGSSPMHWFEMKELAQKLGLLFVPSVGPGYTDVKVRPWNRQNTHAREGFAYLDRMFHNAMETSPDIISITSWNEWHEGTNIEPAVPRDGYEDYEDAGGPDAYLSRVGSLVDEWRKKRKSDVDS
eukprot:gnl/TRDRNA2_/TRDRNA2_86243_c1_seq2.p1 gnl/TRDRNA2_/TRDRNA2_86243_c1~~gnl/TRDRNA2_/TRDRNA2_86243_c1_seq2.p1  ORF type:complete len:192 (+),score=28.34 gnl/TRDRNA2_/TRDRNA2_86243_c1_seq2:52-627(+)